MRTIAGRRALAILSTPEAAPKGRVLAYHGVGTPEWGIYDTPPDDFHRQVTWALEHGYRFVPASSVAQGAASEMDLALTFDDGLASVVQNAAPFLKELGLPSTLFVISGKTGGQRLDWGGIRAAQSMGMSIGSHSVSHRDFSTLNAAQTLEELLDSAAAIESHLGGRVGEFAIPYGKARNWSQSAQDAARARYDNIYSFCERGRFPGTIGRTALLSFDGVGGFVAALEGRLDRWHD